MPIRELTEADYERLTELHARDLSKGAVAMHKAMGMTLQRYVIKKKL